MALGASRGEDPGLRAFSAPSTLIEDKKGTYPRLRLKRIATLPLSERPLLLICLDIPKTHIHLLLGAQYITPYLARGAQEDGTILDFTKTSACV